MVGYDVDWWWVVLVGYLLAVYVGAFVYLRQRMRNYPNYYNDSVDSFVEWMFSPVLIIVGVVTALFLVMCWLVSVVIGWVAGWVFPIKSGWRFCHR